jgi:hypothetical protein
MTKLHFFYKKFTYIADEIGAVPNVQEALRLAHNSNKGQFLKFDFQFITAGDVIKVTKSIKNKKSFMG